MESTGSSESLLGDIQAAASQTASQSVRHKKTERSCLLCHERKIRCDKRSPCANCVRADVLCCYPGAVRPGRRPPKSTIAEVAARVTRLERTITAISNNNFLSNNINTIKDDSSVPLKSPSDETNNSETPTMVDSPEELLVQDGYSTRYINEVLLSRVLEEERELQLVMGSPSDDKNRVRKSSSVNIGGIFSGFNQSMEDTQTYHPSRWHAMLLWQAFVNNVDPIAKILHIPTTQTIMFAAINNPNNLEADLSALLFSIYFAATTSLTSSAAANLLGKDKSTALSHYKQGLEQSLAAANILDTPSMRSLQAMTIYLTCLRAYNGGRSGWTLNGLAIRSAQSIGLHRDGKNFNLPPFESEMRRRLWWYMCAIDSRSAEDHGITLKNSDESSDTRFPTNIDDSELYPNMQEFPAGKAKWTEMAFSLTMIEATHVMKRLHQPEAPLDVTCSQSSREQILHALMTRLEDTYLKHCDSNIPIQNATLVCGRLMVAKLKFLVSQPRLNRSDAAKHLAHPNEDALVAGCRILEMDLRFQAEDLLRGYRWYFETYTQYHVLTYMLWHLCIKPTGSSVDRAWIAIDRSFEVANHRGLSCEPLSKWKVLQLLRDKALRIRRSCSMEVPMNNAGPGDPPAMKMVIEGFEASSDLAFGDDQTWDFNNTSFDMNSFEGVDFSI